MARKRGRASAAAGGRGNGDKGGGRESNYNYEKCSNMEANTMIILDTSKSDAPHHVTDDRLTFMQAVRNASLVPENGNAPTQKMLNGTFKILREEESLSIMVESYQLLNELDKRYPRVYFCDTEKSGSSSSSQAVSKLTVVKEAWSPFLCGIDATEAERKKNLDIKFDPSGFHSLIEDIVKIANKENSEGGETKDMIKSCLLRQMLLFHYLVNVLEGDFFPRNHAFKENMNWNLLRESILNVILGSRKISYKALLRDCLSVLCGLSQVEMEACLMEMPKECDAAMEFGLPEIVKTTCIAMKKLLLMIMELDSSRSIADMHGLITRADGLRISPTEIILDELIYNNALLSPFFMAFDVPEWKVKIILQYFQKYIPKSSGRTRKSNGSSSDATLDGIFKYLSNGKTAKSITKKIGTTVARLLLAHAFQAYLSASLHHHPIEDISDSKTHLNGINLAETCKNLLSAFSYFRSEDEQQETLPFCKEALFTAATILAIQPENP